MTTTKSRYQRDGYAVVRRVLDHATVTASIDHLQVLEGAGPPARPIITAQLCRDRFLAGLAEDSRLVAIARGILEAPVIPFGCTYFVKAPRIGLPVLWHQDGHPWQRDLGIVEAVTLWIALDPSGADNGGLQVIPGSHALDPQPLEPNREQASVFGAEIAPELVDADLVQQLVLDPGDLCAHHPNLIHGSPPNPSDRPRRALAVRYRGA